MANTKRDGVVSRDEYFRWALTLMEYSGASSALGSIFSEFDKSGDGKVNAYEFERALQKFGFGEASMNLFNEIDKDRTGSIQYFELLASIETRRDALSDECKRFLTKLSFEICKPREGRVVTFSKDAWTASKGSEIRSVLRARMYEASARPWDLWRAFMATVDAKHKLLREQFPVALRQTLGYAGEALPALYAYDNMDRSDDNAIFFESFLSWMNNVKAKIHAVRDLSLRSREDDDMPLADIHWSADILRGELQLLLLRANLNPFDLVIAYDKSDDRQLDKKEFIRMMRRLVSDDDVWEESNVKDVVIEVFANLSGNDKSIDVEEIHRWLMKGWEDQKDRERASVATVDAPILTSGHSKPALMTLDSVPSRLGAPSPSLTPQPLESLMRPRTASSTEILPSTLSSGCLSRAVTEPNMDGNSQRHAPVAFTRLRSAARHATELAERAAKHAREAKVAAEFAAAAVASAERQRTVAQNAAKQHSNTEAIRRRQVQQRETREKVEARLARARQRPRSADVFVLPPQMPMSWAPMVGVPSNRKGQGFQPVPYWL